MADTDAEERKQQFRARLGAIARYAEVVLRRLAAPPPDPELFERHLAFRFDPRRGLLPIAKPALFDLDDLVGVDVPLAKLIENTEQFLHGLPRNHVLLYGERGTGKSSAVRGLLHRYGADGLRVVEVQRDDLVHLPDILEAIAPAGDKRFLVYCDDLSFEHGDGGYRELKAALEGSVEPPPENVCIVVTSNRRRLLPETRQGNQAGGLDEDGELHLGEALEEKLALGDRFGLMLGFYAFKQQTYLDAIARHLARHGSTDSVEDVRAEALRFALEKGNRSGRTARQFVDAHEGRKALAQRKGA